MLQLYLFGPLCLLYNGHPLKFAALPKTLPLFAYLLLNRTKPIPRTTLAFSHWPDSSETEARSNLRRHLYELRRVLPPTAEECPWLLVDNHTVQWNPTADYWCDVVAFEEATETNEGLAEAVRLYTGDLLPELYEDWSFSVRERLRNTFFILDNLEQVAGAAPALAELLLAAPRLTLLVTSRKLLSIYGEHEFPVLPC